MIRLSDLVGYKANFVNNKHAIITSPYEQLKTSYLSNDEQINELKNGRKLKSLYVYVATH